MAVKNIVSKAWTITPSSDGKCWSAWPAGDKPSLPAAPAWYPAAGEWGSLPNSNLSTSGVMESGAAAVIAAWGGGAINTVGIYNGATFIAGTFLIIWGGGHNDYAGNELYAYGPFEADTPQWYKPRDSTVPNPTNVDEDGSGNPVARHTYGSFCYVGGARNKLFAIGTHFRSTDASTSGLSKTFNFNQASPNTTSPWAAIATTSIGAPANACAYDPTTDRIWYHGGGGNVSYYDVATNTDATANFKSAPWSSTEGAVSIDTSRGIWAAYANVLGFYRLNNGTANDYYVPTQTGTAPSVAHAGIQYDPVDDRFACWGGVNKQVFFLTPPASSPYQGGNAWTWSSVTPGAGSTPTAATTNGTYGRFNIVNNGTIRGYVLLNAANDTVYFYRPSTA